MPAAAIQRRSSALLRQFPPAPITHTSHLTLPHYTHHTPHTPTKLLSLTPHCVTHVTLHPSQVSQLVSQASLGVADPTLLRRSLRNVRATADSAAFRRAHDHPGFHPYRVILGEVRVLT